jgi:hypothetical protein
MNQNQAQACQEIMTWCAEDLENTNEDIAEAKEIARCIGWLCLEHAHYANAPLATQVEIYSTLTKVEADNLETKYKNNTFNAFENYITNLISSL